MKVPALLQLTLERLIQISKMHFISRKRQLNGWCSPDECNKIWGLHVSVTHKFNNFRKNIFHLLIYLFI